MKKNTEGVQKIWDKYKYAALVVLIGAGLLLWPSGRNRLPGTKSGDSETAAVRELQSEMETILSSMSGVGQVRVLLTAESDGERQLAQNTELRYSGETAAPSDYSRRSEAVLTGAGSSGDEAIVVRTLYPTYRGALVVCQGGDRAEVQLAVTQAVSSLTGLTADRITVAKWQ